MMSMSLHFAPISACAVSVSMASACWAEACTIPAQCGSDTPCEPREIVLNWSEQGADEITVNGQVLQAHWSIGSTVLDEMNISGQTWTIRTQGPMIHATEGRTVMIIAPSQIEGEVTINGTNMPQKYVDHETVVARLTKFSGVCEGLF
jgi:hypothetical protein